MTQTLAPTDSLTRELENLGRSHCASELLLAGETKSGKEAAPNSSTERATTQT
ncbi:BnaC07g03090D [Brassica napus]|uniref:Uncharacterized protein n=2 Tax=Brassica TaxID=3705 RepID=A0A8X7QAU2_BRACI|nr:hypothetical protein Bca52824_073925 [Brassica carinata]CAF1949406.1 unnamed protein product [Brassica napus]CDY13010.1 BnaC07g03090D [Brassica napus]